MPDDAQTKRREVYDHLLIEANRLLAAESTGFKHPNGLVDLAVTALYWAADFLGVTYEEINVWIFCIFWPLSMLVLVLQTVLMIRLKHSGRRW